MRLPLIRPLLLALTLSLGTTAAMISHAQTSKCCTADSFSRHAHFSGVAMKKLKHRYLVRFLVVVALP